MISVSEVLQGRVYNLANALIPFLSESVVRRLIDATLMSVCQVQRNQGAIA